jgi:hypothetical protein
MELYEPTTLVLLHFLWIFRLRIQVSKALVAPPGGPTFGRNDARRRSVSGRTIFRKFQQHGRVVGPRVEELGMQNGAESVKAEELS